MTTGPAKPTTPLCGFDFANLCSRLTMDGTLS
jgi:hypothetical protein